MTGRLGRALLRVAPQVRCARCGRPLFTAVPLIRDGRLQLFGAERAVVRVEWTGRRTLAFRHEAADACDRELTLTIAEL